MRRIAVIGSGVSGLGAAWALDKQDEVIVYEADTRLGGHANPVALDDIGDDGQPVVVDTGFIVYNEPNYPNLARLFEELAVPTKASDMSLAVSVGGGAFEYQARAGGFFAQPGNIGRSGMWGMLRDYRRFCREAPSLLASNSRVSLGEFLDQGGYGEAFRVDLLLPMTAAIWSTGLEDMLAFPAATLVRFMSSHELLQMSHRPAWRTVVGGSGEYVRRISAGFRDRVRLATPVRRVQRRGSEVAVWDGAGNEDRFDEVVFATHADTTLQILGADARPREREILSTFRFQENVAVLHRDRALMPKRHRVWASWNYVAEGRAQHDRVQPVSLTYWMNRLQSLDTAEPVFVTLNPLREPEGKKQWFSYEHPVFDQAALDSQERLFELQGRERTWFAGAWSGYGFHEDGLRSGLEVARGMGAAPPWGVAPKPLLVGASS